MNLIDQDKDVDTERRRRTTVDPHLLLTADERERLNRALRAEQSIRQAFAQA